MLYIVNFSIETLIREGFLPWQTVAHALETQNVVVKSICTFYVQKNCFSRVLPRFDQFHINFNKFINF